jgi:hypothetical protein
MLTKKPKYIIREVLDGNGKITYHNMIRFGYFWPFDWYFSKYVKDTLKEANDLATEWTRKEEFEKGEKTHVSKKDYNIGTVPSHIPKSQEERFLKCLKRK